MGWIVGNRRTGALARAAALLMGLAAVQVSAAADGTSIPGAAHPALWPRSSAGASLDPAIERRITALMSAMTLEQKVGQLIQADIGSITPEDLIQYPLGSVLNGGNSAPGRDALAPPNRWLAAADGFYAASMNPSHGSPIPIFWGIDAVHGANKLVGATVFPHNIALGAARDPALVRRIGEITALEVRTIGLDWTFGPTLAVARDLRWGRSYESYASNPQLVGEYAKTMVLGLQGEPGTAHFLDAAHVIATAKHFLGDGGTGGHDQGDNTAPEAELRDIHGVGYPAAIAAGVQGVMASFSSWQGVKMSGNASLLTGVLKERMGFTGLAIGDWNSHAQVPGCSRASCAAAINAGLDVLMAPDDWKPLFESTLAQARSGEILPARLDDAVRRILRVKLRAHLFEEGPPSRRTYAGRFELLGDAAHRAVARQAVRESLVLLKNQGHLLPLSPGADILVAGDGADSIPKQSGGWTITWQGTGTTNENFPHAQSIYAGIAAAVGAAGGHAQLSPDGTHTGRPAAAIVVFGENPYAEFQGDIPTLEYNNRPDIALLARLKSEGIPVVAVFLSGRPLWVNPAINAANAFVAAWLPGTEGGGIADVLFKTPQGRVRFDFHGKLPFAWPASPLPAPGEAPLFAYGHGLTYSDKGDLAPLPENIELGAAAPDSRTFFTAGRPGEGWRWTVSEGSLDTELPQGTGSSRQGAIQVSAIDRAAQEDARLLRFAGGAGQRAALTGLKSIDLQREANGQLSLALDYRVDAQPAGDVALQMECGAGCRGQVPIGPTLAQAPAGQWRQLKVPLSCFAKGGADLGHITSPFALTTAGTLTLRVANIRLESGLEDLLPCGG